ncbi:uncharacterized protein LOC117289159 [Asterias rubens]|uniref:uncharacterized protein LOC117289159 n=1 Tax=Asterias rubens TaxID=7604 RepID=UPI00145516CC|nr:uncharacterized protein LOC117289159 [Asterias rubens]
MANAASPEVDFSAEGVRDFIIKHGGKVSNVAVVGHFMAYLRHPDKEVKEANRKKFREYMNEVAVIKKDEKDDKVVVLKRKKKEMNYGDFVDHPKLVIFKDNPAQLSPVISDPIPIVPNPTEEPARPPRRSDDADKTIAVVTGPLVTDDGMAYTGPREQGDVLSTKEGERIIDQKRQIQSVKSFADIFDQEVQSKKEEVDRLKSPIRSPQKTANKRETSEQNGEVSATRQEEGQGSLKDDDTAAIISPDSSRNSLNCEDALLVPQPGLQSSGTMQSISSEASTSCSTDTIMHWQQLEPLEHQWMMEAAKANLTALSNLLKQDISLAGKKDFITVSVIFYFNDCIKLLV